VGGKSKKKTRPATRSNGAHRSRVGHLQIWIISNLVASRANNRSSLGAQRIAMNRNQERSTTSRKSGGFEVSFDQSPDSTSKQCSDALPVFGFDEFTPLGAMAVTNFGGRGRPERGVDHDAFLGTVIGTKVGEIGAATVGIRTSFSSRCSIGNQGRRGQVEIKRGSSGATSRTGSGDPANYGQWNRCDFMASPPLAAMRSRTDESPRSTLPVRIKPPAIDRGTKGDGTPLEKVPKTSIERLANNGRVFICVTCEWWRFRERINSASNPK